MLDLPSRMENKQIKFGAEFSTYDQTSWHEAQPQASFV